ncbi:phosphatidylethanolamine N-methyltransferase [Rhizodiscina lignyota]|uniref:Phosphatidylethanolamine N-methyltransferase n=1 Tax=Rhizodiscina lignyota TaxID=1504668 RepID=A0A9P4IKQ9_9PEZI|nr:phosphatidylethanolamine N-methyltransferase [Rhizodiscina lignyota]
MSSTSQDATASASSGDLRARLKQQPEQPQRATTEDDARKAVEELNATDYSKDSERKESGENRTYGRTPDGTVFTVPQTHDMVSQLFSPTEPKNVSDFILIAILAFHVSMLVWIPQSVRVPVLALVYIFWRAAYNVGIGWLLHEQSHHRRLVRWAKQSRIFEDPAKGNNPHPRLYKFMKREFETKVPEDYKFDEAPLEYNTWLLFRRFVDVILLCDFVAYCTFAIACGGRPENEGFALTIARWIGGIILFLFNLWVKLDAHRVVKDFAWYWGDFFFLIDQELTFDGVFEMAPHPMYSVGYAGYYGISLMAASYKVLFISILGHAAQLTFLALVENPHIDKTYSAPPPRKRKVSDDSGMARPQSPDNSTEADGATFGESQPYSVQGLKGLMNVDIHHMIYFATGLSVGHLAVLTLLTPSTPLYQALFVINALGWRLWFSLGISYILDRQSTKKSWTRHFIKYGETSAEAWKQWKLLYHLSLSMTHASFIAAALKMYALPDDWTHGFVLLRHVLGLALVALQIWTAVSIYDSLGEFGWFFGDFFFDVPGHRLTYSGIYRFLNNPERVLGLAGLWGVALITSSTSIFFLALLSHILSLGFIQFIERPHMQRRYGETIRDQSGLSKSIRRTLPDPIKHWQGSVDRVLEETMEYVEEVIETARPKLAKGVGTIFSDTRKLFRQYPARISITRVAPELADIDPQDYKLEIEGSESGALRQMELSRGIVDADARGGKQSSNGFKALMFEYGTPIKVKWTAPKRHSKKDWVGLYMVSDNDSREITRLASNGRWIPTNKGEYDSDTAELGLLTSDMPVESDGDVEQVCGEMVFEGDKLFWTTGVLEFRYHHAGKHSVMAISLPFEIRIPRFDEDDAEIDANGMFQTAVEQALLPVVRNCFNRDPEIAPNTVEEEYGDLIMREGKWAKRVVFAVHQMFGIEFAPEVVQADGTVRKLAWRICNAKKVLAPYSMSSKQGRSTPTGSR